MTLLDSPLPMTAVTPSRATLPVLPETAPFTPAQRAWLNGFLAGLLNTHPAGSGSGTAVPLDTSAAPAPEVEEELPWHEPSIPLDERLKLADGKPIALQLMAAMAQLDCG